MMTTYEMAMEQGRKQAKPLLNAHVANALVAQKDHLLKMFQEADEANDVYAAIDALKLFGRLWESIGYGYKVKEVCQVAVDRCYKLEASAKEMASLSHKNSSYYHHCVSEIPKLGELIADLCTLRSKGVSE